MPSTFNICTQPLDEYGQAKACPCQYTKTCPDSTVECDYGQHYCHKCFTDADGKFHHSSTEFPCNAFTPLSRDCAMCAYNYNIKMYSSLLGEYRPFRQCNSAADADGDLPF